MRKKKVISTMGFRGLLQLACREIYFDMCQWIMSKYEVPYHWLMMGHNKLVSITAQDVSDVLGVPCEGIAINLVYRRSTPKWKYCLKDVEGDLVNQLVGDRFSKYFPNFCMYNYPSSECQTRGYEISFGMVIYQCKGAGQN